MRDAGMRLNDKETRGHGDQEIAVFLVAWFVLFRSLEVWSRFRDSDAHHSGH